MADYLPGDVVWANLDPIVGSEQAGHRPVLVISGELYNVSVPNVVIVVPITTRDRGRIAHVALHGPELTLEQISFAMSEQPRTGDRRRLGRTGGRVDASTLAEVRRNLARFLELPKP